MLLINHFFELHIITYLINCEKLNFDKKLYYIGEYKKQYMIYFHFDNVY
jgi:hypothetical protein